MALIPLSEIPNAANITNPVAIPQAGANTNLTSSLGELQQSPMALDSFSGSARGLEALGESGKRVAAVFGDFSLAMAHANDVAGAAKATNIMNSAYADHMAAMTKDGVPPDQWAAKWTNESMPKAQDAISKIQVSPRAAEGLNAQVSMWGSSATSKINLAGIGQHIEDGKADLMMAIGTAKANGDWEGVFSLGQSGVDSHLLRGSQWEAMKKGYMQEQTQGFIYADMNAHPRQAGDTLAMIKADPNNPKIPDHYKEVAKNPILVDQLAYQNRRILGVARSEQSNTLIEGVYSGDIKTKEDVDALNHKGGDIWTQTELKQAYAALSMNVQYDPVKAAKFHYDIANVNAVEDFDLSKKDALLNRVNEMPAELRPTYAEMINKAYNPTPDTKIPTLIKQGNFAQVQDWKKAGLLGATGMEGSTVGTTPEEVTAYNKLAQREVDYQVAFEQAQEGGQIKTPDEAEAFTQKFWAPEISQNSAKVKANTEPSRWDKFWGAPSAPVPFVPADAQKAIDSGLPQATPGALPPQSSEDALRYDAKNLILDGHPVVGADPSAITQRQNIQDKIDGSQYETKLSSDEEAKFQDWKKKYAPKDSGEDYDLRGAFKDGLTPSPTDGHWPDTYKKPNEPTFSDQSIYARDRPDLAGHWDENNNFVLPNGKPQAMNTTDPVEFVKGLEGFTPKAEFDYKQTSVGYGTRAKSAGETLTKPEAEARLKEELSVHSERIDKAADSSGISLTPAQRTALISFDFNTGKGADLIETSDTPEEIAARMAKYTKVTVNGKKVENRGLVNRRAAELELFNS